MNTVQKLRVRVPLLKTAVELSRPVALAVQHFSAKRRSCAASTVRTPVRCTLYLRNEHQKQQITKINKITIVTKVTKVTKEPTRVAGTIPTRTLQFLKIEVPKSTYYLV